MRIDTHLSQCNGTTEGVYACVQIYTVLVTCLWPDRDTRCNHQKIGVLKVLDIQSMNM